MTHERIHDLFSARVITAEEAADWVFQERWLNHHKAWHRNWMLLTLVAVAMLGIAAVVR